MRSLTGVASRLGPEARFAIGLVGGVVAVWTLFAVGAAVWYGVLPPGSFLGTLLVVFLALVVLVPIPDGGPDPEPHPVWQRELADDRDAAERDTEDGGRKRR